MNSKHLRDQDITLNNDGAAGEKIEIVYSCAGPRIVPEEDLKENSPVNRHRGMVPTVDFIDPKDGLG